jgi:hypothetical protein
MTVEVFGRRVTRKAKAEYSFTPEWPYFDLHKLEPFDGWPGSSMSMKFLNVPEEDHNLGEPAWEEVDVQAIGAVWDAIEDAIEERCKVEDADPVPKIGAVHRTYSSGHVTLNATAPTMPAQSTVPSTATKP